MSLLLQALQKAAKSREDGETPAPPAGGGMDPELELEPVQSEPTLAEELGAPDVAPATASPAARAQAATVVQAGRAAPGFDPIDYAREHYMLSLVAVAILFALLYGGYVYIQIAQPFGRSAPVPVAAVVPAPPPVTQQQSVPAKLSGMPGAETPAAQAEPAAPAAAATPASATSGVLAPQPQRVVEQPSIGEAPPRITRPAATRSRPRAESVPARPNRAETLADASDTVETVVIQPSSPPARDISVRRDTTAASDLNPLLVQAYEALQNGDDGRARELYLQVLQAEPRSIDARLGLGAIAWKQGRADEAAQHYQRVLELEPHNAYAQAGLIAIIGGADPQASEGRLKQLIAREPSAFLHFTLGNLYADQGQWPAAQQAYFQAYQMQTDNPDYAFNLAVALEHLGQNRPALDYYRKALDLSFRKAAPTDQNPSFSASASFHPRRAVTD
jgi:Tfp pilus assembly protein PilF